MAKSEESIVKIIRKMVSEGAIEEEIIRTLEQLGVEPEKAKRLLLLGEADTFALMEKEIGQIVKKRFEEEMPRYIKELAGEAREAGKISKELAFDDLKKKINRIVSIEGYEKEISNRVGDFEKNISNLTVRMDKLEKQAEKTSSTVEKLEGARHGLAQKIFALLILLVGLGLSGTALYFIFTYSQTGTILDKLELIVGLAIAGVIAMFVSTRV